MGQNPIPLVNPKIAGKWMVIPLKMVLIGIDPYPNNGINHQLVQDVAGPSTVWRTSPTLTPGGSLPRGSETRLKELGRSGGQWFVAWRCRRRWLVIHF